MSQIVMIKLQGLQIYHKQIIQLSYLSFKLNDKLYFSSVYDSNTCNINDDIIIPIQSEIPSNLSLQVWQNHMVLFHHNINISQLGVNNKCCKKQYEINSMEILSFTIYLYNNNQLAFSNKYIESISQQYLLISNLSLSQQKNKIVVQGPTYFEINTNNAKYILCITDAIIVIQLPNYIQFKYYKGNNFHSKSNRIPCTKLQQIDEIIMSNNEHQYGGLVCNKQWGINLQRLQPNKPSISLLMAAYEILIYDIQIKFDHPHEIINGQIKLIYGNKCFILSNQLSNIKIYNFKKIIHTLIKSQIEQIDLQIQRNNKIIAKTKIITDQIKLYQKNVICLKLYQPNNNKNVGKVRFISEIGRNLSVQYNNILWKQLSKKNSNSLFKLHISQISACYNENQPIMILIKTDKNQYQINNIPNIQFYQPEERINSDSVLIQIKSGDTVYLMISKNQKTKIKANSLKEEDFLGICILKYDDLRLGLNTVRLDYYKNQQKIGKIFCLINKIVNWPFIKASYQPQNIPMNGIKTIILRISLDCIQLTSYYYSFGYENKQQLYCIIEINKVKKVLIMQHDSNNKLILIKSNESDILQFLIYQSEVICIKITMMVSDIGQDEQIYGIASIKLKKIQIDQQSIIVLSKIQLKNQYNTIVGELNLKIQKKQNQTINKSKQKQIKQISKSLQIKNQVQNKITKRYNNNVNVVNHRIDQSNIQIKQKQAKINLPLIQKSKKQKKNNIGDVMMKMRKRSSSGYYDDKVSALKNIERKEHYSGPQNYQDSYRNNRTINLNSIKQNNPNLDHNLKLLFPKKNQQNKILLQRQIKQYEEKMIGLKSVLDQIDSDIGQVQPSLNSDKNQKNIRYNQKNNKNQKHKDIQWQGNQFI